MPQKSKKFKSSKKKLKVGSKRETSVQPSPQAQNTLVISRARTDQPSSAPPTASGYEPNSIVPTAHSYVSSPSVSPYQPSSAAPPSVHMFQGSTNFKIENSILTNTQGNVTIYKFDVGGPPSEEFKSLFAQHVAGSVHVQDLDKEIRRHVLSQAIRDLPRTKAAYNDYTSSDLRHVACFEGTRQALLEEIAQWLTSFGGTRACLLFGVAGIGKSTVAHTVAERADNLRLLGASFFFSRDEADRRNAEKFFTTIAFQLCVYDKQFSEAIGAILTEDQGAAATLKDPQAQLRVLILEPLRDITKSRLLPIVIIVDALDECDDQDVPLVLTGLNRLVKELPCFKIMMTTRPQPHLPRVLTEHKVFHLQNIEEKIVDGDIRRYLKHNLAWPQVAVSMPRLTVQWNATDVEVESLVQSAGRLFIMASTLVRFVLDTRAHDPESQMNELKIDGRVSLHGLGHFYTVILRRAVPSNQHSMVRRFNAVIGTILVVQEPLPVRILEHLTKSYSAISIRAVLANLESVIMLNDDIPRMYHKSFFDFVTDPHHCPEDLLIDMKSHHTRVATRCFQIMNKGLRQNILDLGTPARFMDNDDGIAAENISPEQLAKKIPGELQYACIYWPYHIKDGDGKDVNLNEEVGIFITEHLLHWLEALSWIRKLDIAYHAVSVLAKYTSTSSDSSGIISDALHFIPRFFWRISHSALHAYYSALPFTPTESHFYKCYSKQMIHGFCRLEGATSQWDPLIALFARGLEVDHLVFSHDSSKFASNSYDERQLRLWDVEKGMLLRSYDGDCTTIAGDFSVAATSQDYEVTLWNVASNAPDTTLSQSAKVVKLALLFDGSRLATGLSNGTVHLWNAKKDESLASLESYGHDGGQLEFSPRSYRLAFVSDDGTIRLWNGENGHFIARLDYKSKKHVKFAFSRDGCRLAALVKEGYNHSLTVWDGERGTFVDVAENVGDKLAISEDGSLIATGGVNTSRLDLWRGSPLSRIYSTRETVTSLALSYDILAVGSFHEGGFLTLYDVNSLAVIGAFQHFSSDCLAWSPDCTRLAVGVTDGGSRLYDVPLLKASYPASKRQNKGFVTALAFSFDSSRLASGLTCGVDSGTIELWDTNHPERPIADMFSEGEIKTLAFSLNGEQFASYSNDRKVIFWDGKDGELIDELELGLPFDHGRPGMAFSPDLLAVGTTSNITLFDYMSLRLVNTLEGGGWLLSFSVDGSLLVSASGHPQVITIWNVTECATMATFTLTSFIHSLTLSPDNSQLVAQSIYPDPTAQPTCPDVRLDFFDIVNNHAFELAGHEDLSWVPNFKNGLLISSEFENHRMVNLSGQLPGSQGRFPLLWIAEEFNAYRIGMSSSMMALGCFDGRVLFVRFPTAGTN